MECWRREIVIKGDMNLEQEEVVNAAKTAGTRVSHPGARSANYPPPGASAMR